MTTIFSISANFSIVSEWFDKMSVVYVYRGPGCSAQALGMLYNMLSEFCDARRHRVQFISPEEIVEG